MEQVFHGLSSTSPREYSYVRLVLEAALTREEDGVRPSVLVPGLVVLIESQENSLEVNGCCASQKGGKYEKGEAGLLFPALF